jgi:GNAT superfamily N-acetyltransferase
LTVGAPPRVVPIAAALYLDDLAAILADAVEGGASVSFMLPFTLDEARAFWRRVAARAEAGDLVTLGAFTGDRLDGTVQLVTATPPNQPHRAEIAKLLVHRRARRQGFGRALMLAAESLALARGRTLLTLDTLAGSPAEQLYLGLGYAPAGAIPGYALLPTGGEPLATVVFYKPLRPGTLPQAESIAE